jgi:outer membrane protein OmpA-like peptidoglycan-associated protein
MRRCLFPLAALMLALSLLAGCGSPAPVRPIISIPAPVVAPVTAPPPPPQPPVRVEAPKAPSALAEFESGIAAAAAESGVKVEKADEGELLLRTGGDAAFAPASTSPTPRYAAFLKQLASRLAQHQSLNVRITCHTDATGNTQRNEKLTEGRARAAARVLTQNGIAPFRVLADGKGKREPIAGNDTAAGRAANRRVDIVVTDGR